MLSESQMGELYDLPIELAIAGLPRQCEQVTLLLAEYDRLAAEVERLTPLAEVGEAVGRGIEIEPGDHCLRALSITHQRDGAMEGAYRVFGYRVGNSGRIDPAGKRSGDGATLAAALRDAGLMGKGEEVAP